MAPAFFRVMLCALMGASAAGVTRPPAGTSAAVRAFLADNFGLDAGAIRALDSRHPIARSLDTTDDREIATLGVIRIDVPPAFYAAHLRDIVGFKRNEAVLQIGAFGTPARPSDLAGLTLERSDVDQLADCRPGSCKVQLSDDAIRRFASEVPWHTPGAESAANRLMRDVLAGMVNHYRESGDRALMVYADGDKPLSLSDEFRRMIASRPAVLDRFPPLARHLAGYPGDAGDGVDDILYWSKEKVGPRVVVSVTHLAIAPLTGAGPAAFAVASKQLYGTHYFDASLGVTVLLADQSAGAGTTCLVYVNRSRIDALGGLFGGLKRVIVRSHARSTMAESLMDARDRVEASAAKAPGNPDY